MFEIPFNFILINPAVDTIIFISIAYFFLFRIYKKVLKENPEKIMWMDFQSTIIFLSFGYLNYSEKSIDFWGFKMEWWFYIIMIQLIIEGVFITFNWEDAKYYLKIMKKNSQEKEKENIISTIQNMKSIVNLMEQDLNKYKIQGNNKSVLKLENEIYKIEMNIKELEIELNDLKNKKND